MDTKIIKQAIGRSEKNFAFPNLLKLPYFAQLRSGCIKTVEDGWPIGVRDYITLLHKLNDVHLHDQQHGKSFAKRFRTAGNDTRNSDATFAELIVYQNYIRLVHDGLINGIELQGNEADLIIVGKDGARSYYEVFSVKPDFKFDGAVHNITTHQQEALSSIRQKLLQKIQKQKQMNTPRNNFAVIELNHPLIASDFTVHSSLSSGYKVHVNLKTGKSISEGYDWSDSIFDSELTQHIKAIIYFSMGDYQKRKYIFNPQFKKQPNKSGQSIIASTHTE